MIRPILEQNHRSTDFRVGGGNLVAKSRCARGPQDSTGGKQQKLAQLLDGTFSWAEFSWSPATVSQLAGAARKKGED